MNLKYDIIIVGAGPAGMFTAININSDKRVLIVEKMKSAGKKLLMSGSGKCNITQAGDINDFFTHYGDNKNFLMPALKQFTNEDLIAFLECRGIRTINKNGKVFPSSENSEDILKLLLKECRKKNITINYDEKIIKVMKNDNRYEVTSNKSSYQCDILVIATGGKSYPSTGSTGDGYVLAKSLGHTIKLVKPALTPVFIKDYRFSELSGISLKNAKITLFRNMEKIKNNRGDVLFTHNGLSGPGILDISRYILANDTLKINMINKSCDEFEDEIINIAAYSGKSTVKNLLKNTGVPENLIKAVLSELNIDTRTLVAEVSKSQRKRIVEMFCNYPFIVKSVGDFNVAMATKGGISLEEVNSKTLESKLVKNLYFVGEVLDIDGDTGGYNLQAAFSTGYLAAKYI